VHTGVEVLRVQIDLPSFLCTKIEMLVFGTSRYFKII
jgi:hypothetical protein